MKDNNLLGRNIQRLREIHGDTLEELGVAIGFAKSTINAMCDLPREFVNNKNIQAVTQNRIIQGKSIFISIYKERNRVIGNIRFSKAHELGHIFLKHFDEFEIPSSLDISSSREYWVLEREAEMFAAELLAPTAILRACNCYDKRSIKLLCNLSDEASEYVVSDINRDYNLMESEKAALECQFDDFIRNKEYLLLTSIAFCEICGAPLDSNDKYCRICGSEEATNVRKDNMFLYPSSIPVKETGRVYFCIGCGNTDFPFASKECNLCSAPLYNLCTSCNVKLSGNDRYCGSCGGISTFYKNSLLESWSQVQDRLKSAPGNHLLKYRKVICWEYMIDKLLYSNKLDTYKMLYGSCACENNGKLIIALPTERDCSVSSEILLGEINAISLPYFDITYDDIEILCM